MKNLFRKLKKLYPEPLNIFRGKLLRRAAIVIAVVLIFVAAVIWQASHSGKNSRENFASVLFASPASPNGGEPSEEQTATDAFPDIQEVSEQDQIKDNNENIPLLWADNNDSENLIIKTDKKYYDVAKEVTVYFGIANQTQNDQNTDFYFWFDGKDKSVQSVERIGGGQSSSDKVESPRQSREKFKVQSSNQFQIPNVLNRKSVKNYTSGSQFQDTIVAGQINYYKAIIKSLADVKQSEFFIEAIGDNGGYGHLDPYLASGLVGFWSFNGPDTNWTSATGGTTADLSGNNNTGTMTSMSRSSSPVPGISGQALSFDGTDDYVEVTDPGSSSLDITGLLTVSAWIFKNSNSGNDTVLIKGDSSFIAINYYLQTVGDEIEFGFYDLNGSFWHYDDTLSANLQTGRWYHIAAVYNDSANTIDIYVNGSLTEDNNGAGNYSMITNNYPLRIGDNNTNEFFQGLIDDVRVYNRALGASEVQQLYQYGAGRMKANSPRAVSVGSSGLVAYWSFNGQDMNGPTALDRSGYGNNGDASNQKLVPGVNGQALNFNGVDDYVTVSNESNFDFEYNQPFSFSAWVYRNANNDEDDILGKYDNTTPLDGYNFDLYNPAICPNGCLHFYMYDEGSGALSVRTNDGTIPNKNWIHVAVTYNGNYDDSGVKFYINGALQADINISNLLSGSILNNGNFKIGTDNTISTDFFNGIIDEVRIYDRALSADEIQQLYQSGAARMKVNSPPSAPFGNSGLVGYWSFNGADTNWTSATGGTTADLSGNNNTGTLSSMNRGTTPTAGISGQALQFSGASVVYQWVDVGTSNNFFQLGTPMTASAWVYAHGYGASDGGRILSRRATGETIDATVEIAGAAGAFGFAWTGNPTSLVRRSVNGSLSLNEWTHILVTWDGSVTAANAHVYKNGTEVAYQTTTNGNGLYDTTGQATKIGNRVSGDRTFDGLIDEVRIYNRVLSASEIQQLYQAGARTTQFKQ